MKKARYDKICIPKHILRSKRVGSSSKILYGFLVTTRNFENSSLIQDRAIIKALNLKKSILYYQLNKLEKYKFIKRDRLKNGKRRIKFIKNLDMIEKEA